MKASKLWSKCVKLAGDECNFITAFFNSSKEEIKTTFDLNPGDYSKLQRQVKLRKHITSEIIL